MWKIILAQHWALLLTLKKKKKKDRGKSADYCNGVLSLYGDGFIIPPLRKPVSLSLPEGIHGSDEGFSLVLACSQSRSSSLPWLYPHAASGFSKLQSPATKGRNLYSYTVFFPLTCCSNEWIYKLNSPRLCFSPVSSPSEGCHTIMLI